MNDMLDFICIGFAPEQCEVSEKFKMKIYASTLNRTTAKPVYNGHSMEKQKVAVVGRLSLYRGSKFSKPFHFLSDKMFSVWKAFSYKLFSQHKPTLLHC